MPSSSLIAERSVDLVKPSGEQVRFRVKFGPVSNSGRDFRCRVRFHGWGDSPPDIWGYDSLQSVILAIQLVHTILADFIRRGGRVLWPDTSNDYSLDDFLCLPERPKAKRDARRNRRPVRQRSTRTPRKGVGR